ncbi:MAG: biopolymer transporter ExbD [Polyangiaceae bacterium]|nr:biopolymer transporter ExbD [Polyangiaceae bacterium]
MAGIDTGARKSGRRDVNLELPLIPFIDFLLCLVAFLLVTAVWSQMARLSATADVPGKQGDAPQEIPKRLHVAVKDARFELTWKQGATVLSSTSVPRKAVTLADGTRTYPELTARLAEEWQAQGVHRAEDDPKRDLAVLHSSNTEEFGELTAVLDALHGTQRTRRYAGTEERVAAFNVSFATE